MFAGIAQKLADKLNTFEQIIRVQFSNFMFRPLPIIECENFFISVKVAFFDEIFLCESDPEGLEVSFLVEAHGKNVVLVIEYNCDPFIEPIAKIRLI